MTDTLPSSSLPPPRLLVVGGTGRLGGLLRMAWQLRASGLLPVWQSRRAETPVRGAWISFDPLSDPAAFAAAAQAADAVLLLAGLTTGTPEALACNCELALAARDAVAGRPLLYASSAAVYGAGAPLDPARGWSEEDPCHPAAAYGAAKLAAEAVLAEMPGATILRIGNVAGADALLGRPAPEGGRMLDSFADGRAPRRSYIGPQALALALARITRLVVAGIAVPQRINLALPGTVGMDALLRAAGEGWNSRPAPPEAIGEVRLDVSRAVDLGLVADAPARATAIVADLKGLTAAEALA